MTVKHAIWSCLSTPPTHILDSITDDEMIFRFPVSTEIIFEYFVVSMYISFLSFQLSANKLWDDKILAFPFFIIEACVFCSSAQFHPHLYFVQAI